MIMEFSYETPTGETVTLDVTYFPTPEKIEFDSLVDESGHEIPLESLPAEVQTKLERDALINFEASSEMDWHD